MRPRSRAKHVDGYKAGKSTPALESSVVRAHGGNSRRCDWQRSVMEAQPEAEKGERTHGLDDGAGLCQRRQRLERPVMVTRRLGQSIWAPRRRRRDQRMPDWGCGSWASKEARPGGDDGIESWAR